jgi:hypothetical protein
VDVVAAALWGGAGGLTAVITSTVSDMMGGGDHGRRWPGWQQVSAQLFAAVLYVAGSVILAATAAAQMSGPYPAVLIGATAPSVLRGILRRVEVSERTGRGGDDAGTG